MKKIYSLLILLPNLAFASFCGTNTLPPDVRLAQLGYDSTYKSVHYFRMSNTTSQPEVYRLCRSLLLNSKELNQQKYFGECKEITVAPHTTSPVIELFSIIDTTFNGGERMIHHAAVSSIEGACKTNDMKDSKTYLYAYPRKK